MAYDQTAEVLQASRTTKRASGPVTIDIVESLREQWLNSQHHAIDLAHGAAAIQDALNLGAPSITESKEVEAAQLEASARYSAYQDAERRLTAQQIAQREAAADRIAATNTKLGWAIMVATFVSAVATVVQAYFAAKGSH